MVLSRLCSGVSVSSKIEGERVLRWREEAEILSSASSVATARGLQSPTPLQFGYNLVEICFLFWFQFSAVLSGMEGAVGDRRMLGTVCLYLLSDALREVIVVASGT